MFLKTFIIGYLSVVLICTGTVNGSEQDKRDDNESSESTSVGTVIGKLMSKLFGRDSNETSGQSGSEFANTTFSATEATSSVTTSSPSSISTASEKPTTTSETTTTGKEITTGPQTSSTPSMKTTFKPATSTQTFVEYYTNPSEPENCYVDATLKNFCDVPEELTGISFWDLYSMIFSDVVLDALIAECSRGEWCLKGEYDYWNAVIAERVDMVMKSEISSSMCQPDVEACITKVVNSYTNCSIHEQMTYTSTVIHLLCELKRNPELTPECFERTLQALYVTLADIVRGIDENKEAVTASGDPCQQPEAHMTRAIICILNSCPSEKDIFESFPPWAWFTNVVDSVIEKCSLDTTICEGLLQEVTMAWLYNYDMKIMIGVTVASLVTSLLMIFIGCTFWRRHRRNVVIKEGYQQLLNEGDES